MTGPFLNRRKYTQRQSIYGDFWLGYRFLLQGHRISLSFIDRLPKKTDVDCDVRGDLSWPDNPDLVRES